MFDPDHLHIAVASDENYARFVTTLIVSIAKSNKAFKTITIHLLSNSITEKTLHKISDVVGAYSNIELEVYNIHDLDEWLTIDIPPTIARTAYARLFMPSIISQDVSRILYLDTDIVVDDDLTSLWNINLQGNLIGGCLDVFEGVAAKINVGLAPDAPYINSGVLLIDLESWRRENLCEKFTNFLYAHNGDVHHHDQGIINGVCKGKILLLPPQYNMHSTIFSHSYRLINKITTPYYTEDEYLKALNNPVIIHFTEGFYNRPWKENCRHPMRHKFISAQDATPWADNVPEPDSRSIAVKLLSWTFLNTNYVIYHALSSLLSMVGKLQKL